MQRFFAIRNVSEVDNGHSPEVEFEHARPSGLVQDPALHGHREDTLTPELRICVVKCAEDGVVHVVPRHAMHVPLGHAHDRAVSAADALLHLAEPRSFSLGGLHADLDTGQ